MKKHPSHIAAGILLFAGLFVRADVIDTNSPAVAENSTAHAVAPAGFSIKTADGKCEITINTAAAPELKGWAENRLAPVLAGWYPKLWRCCPAKASPHPRILR